MKADGEDERRVKSPRSGEDKFTVARVSWVKSGNSRLEGDREATRARSRRRRRPGWRTRFRCVGRDEEEDREYGEEEDGSVKKEIETERAGEGVGDA